MTDVTLRELIARREQLEVSAAQVLGQMLFEFSRLDMALGLCAVWVDEGQRLEELNPRVADMNFHKRLKFVGGAVEARFDVGGEADRKYGAWISRAQAMRVQRNELVHGRWGVEPNTNQVVNILGLPTSSEQREIKYTIPELNKILVELRSLQAELRHLRDTWPL